ncbi:MAG TPA: OsmC family protein [Candidatus Limnocylindria bacterium]|nr:OsmC family protein [Candidatus Limnocylindria bacterium]
MTEAIRAAIESASTYLREHPDDARYTDSAAVARLEDGLRVTVSGPNGESLVTDMPRGVGGEEREPSPGWYFRAALAACALSLAAMRAAQLGLTGFRCEVEVDSESNDFGILGLDNSTPAGPLSVRLRFSMSADGAGLDRLEEVAVWAADHCPVADAVKRGVPLHIEVTDAG